MNILIWKTRRKDQFCLSSFASTVSLKTKVSTSDTPTAGRLMLID